MGNLILTEKLHYHHNVSANFFRSRIVLNYKTISRHRTISNFIQVLSELYYFLKHEQNAIKTNCIIMNFHDESGLPHLRQRVALPNILNACASDLQMHMLRDYCSRFYIYCQQKFSVVGQKI